MLTAAITADPVGVLAAFGAGILSFLSPCVLPLVPGYLSLVSGLSAAELGSSRSARPASEPQGVAARELALVGAAGSTTAPPDTTLTAPLTSPGPLTYPGPLTSTATTTLATLPIGADSGGSAPTPTAETGSVPPAGQARSTRPARPARPARPVAPLLRGILLFIAGFTVVFVALGATASGVHQVLSSHKDGLITVSGAVVLVLGAIMLASSLPAGVWARLGPRISGRAGWLVGERRFHVRPQTLGAWAAPVMGMAFAFAWTPCIGPVLGAVLALTFVHSTLAGGVVLLFAYSLGLGVPFLVTGFAFDRLTGLYARARKPLTVVQLIAGAVLVAFGAILLAGDLGWLSSQFSSLLDHLGLHRLTVS